ncbi:MAG: hypothetical protein PVF34_01325 [Gammaproteobacteria bacterium]|jgi:hypothetical protein
MIYFVLSVLVLAVLLFFPISKLVWAMSVRRLQRKLNTELEEKQLQGQLFRARFIAMVVSPIFSFLFNLNLLGWPTHG